MAQRPSASVLRELDVSRRDILALDPTLFSAEDKQAYIELLYGNPAEWSWKRDLAAAASNLRRWQLLLSDEPAPGTPYRVQHDRLLRAAKTCPPTTTGETVTDFVDWVFRLYVPERHYENLLHGQRIEREVARRQVPIPTHSGWKLESNGMSNGDSKIYEISQLTINGKRLRGKPDLVFREKRTRRVLIVEVKASEADIPSNGWPNLRAQLWAYAKIDAFQDAPEISAVAEVWGFRGGLRLRQRLRFRPEGPAFERENAELFQRYCEYCEARSGAAYGSGT